MASNGYSPKDSPKEEGNNSSLNHSGVFAPSAKEDVNNPSHNQCGVFAPSPKEDGNNLSLNQYGVFAPSPKEDGSNPSLNQSGVLPLWSQIVAAAASSSSSSASPPLKQDVGGVNCDLAAAGPAFSLDNVDSVKKFAWKKQFGASSLVFEQPFMGADSWPALSKPDKGQTSPKSNLISISEPVKVTKDVCS